MSETILKVEDLKTSFMTSSGEVQAVRGVSFEVHKGEILGIVGESGSGKSVTSMSILRLLADTARIKNGKIEFEGTDLTKVSDKQMREIRGQKIAMVFQDPMSSLNPLIPVGKQVAEMIHVHHPEMKRDELQAATLELFREVRIPEAEKRLKSYPHEFSGGMNENVILEKNENYWDAENVSLQKVTFRYVLDQATALTAYESGEVDGVASIPSSDFARLKAENAGVQTSPSYGTVYYDFNCSAEPVNNVLVRKAICLAIDRQSIIDNVVQVDAQPAYSFLAPGYSVDGKDITEGRESFGLSATADVEGAQAALAEAGYPNGEGFPTLTLSYYDNDTVKKVVEAMAEMLKNNLNINVEVSSNEWSIFYDDVQKGNYQVAAMGWSADYVNPMSFLPLCKTGDSSNNLFYSNADYDALVDQVKAENDPAKAAELTLQADAIVSNDYAVLPLYYKSNNYLMHDNISGFYMTASGNLFFKDVKVG